MIRSKPLKLLSQYLEHVLVNKKRIFLISVNHSNDKEVENVFLQISKDNNGQLDLLVNNAYAGVDLISQQMKKPFWRACPFDTWDTINGVGLRNHFACTAYASR